MTPILSLSGKSRHGKDTCAALIVEMAKEELGITTGRFGFAWPLKSRVYGEAAMQYPLADVLYNKPPAMRTLLQQVGTEMGRDIFGSSFWTLQAEAMVRLMSDAMPDIHLWVISDCRFEEEVAFVRRGGAPVEEDTGALQGLALWIDSDRPTLTGEAALHSSEIALDHMDKDTRFDGRIINNMTTTLEGLKAQLRPHLISSLRLSN